MRKVVINACYGGFGLSDEAERRLVGKCEHVELMEPEKYYGGSGGWQARFEEAKRRGEDLLGINLVDGKIVIDNHSDDDARSCPHLVAVVEEMKDAANGMCAALRVVEIPVGVEYEISEYDGRERVAEAHRTWG
jgi:hypothetical protein